jgi:hypothetical protein
MVICVPPLEFSYFRTPSAATPQDSSTPLDHAGQDNFSVHNIAVIPFTARLCSLGGGCHRNNLVAMKELIGGVTSMPSNSH